MSRTFRTLAPVVFTIICPFAWTQDSGSSREKDAWLKRLRSEVGFSGASIALDLDLSVPVPAVTLGAVSTEENLRVLAMGLNRTARRTEGGYALCRSFDESDVRAFSPSDLALSWLLTSTPAQRERLQSREGMSWTDLDAGSAKSLEYALSKLGSGVGQAMLTTGRQNLRMRIAFQPFVEFTDPSTGTVKRLSLMSGYPPVERRSGTSATATPSYEGTPSHKLAPSPEGSLDYGEGQIRTLNELYSDFLSTFKSRFWYDTRLADSTYFICGKYTKDGFLKVLAQLTMSVQPVEVSGPSFAADGAVQDLIRSVLRNLDEKVERVTANVGDFLLNKSITLASLLGESPYPALASAIQASGLSSNSTVTLRPGLVFYFDTPGMSSSGSGSSVSNTVGFSIRG